MMRAQLDALIRRHNLCDADDDEDEAEG